MSTEIPRPPLLDVAISATHEVLRERLRLAAASHHEARFASRGSFPETDTFLATSSRYLAAASGVLLPVVRRELDDGHARAHEFVHQCRMLELALSQVKAKLYGEAHAIYRGWQEVWDDVHREFTRLSIIESLLIVDLHEKLSPEEQDALTQRLYRAELRAPTRPHPYLPHLGIAGKVARRVAHGVDRFWDSTEGRMIPEPIKPHDHSKDGLLTRYILSEVDPAVDA